MIANVLSIAGSDPSGGAGIQADLKTFSALGAYGMAVITALTAQNTQGVRSFQTVDPAFVAEQIDAIFADVRVDAVKIGMVATAEIAAAIADRLRHHARAQHRARSGDGGEERPSSAARGRGCGTARSRSCRWRG